MVMERHRPLWGRLWARFRGNRNQRLNTTDEGATRTQSQRHVGRSSSSALLHVQSSGPGSYSQQLLGAAHTQSQFSLFPQSGLTDNFRSVHNDRRQGSNSNRGRNYLFNSILGSRTDYYTPKCLVGLDCQALLTGQAKYDDFSENCWLENHLHRFGEVPASDSGHTSDTSETSSHSENSLSTPSSTVPHWHSIFEDFYVPFNGLPPPAPGSSRSIDSPSPQPEVYRGNNSTISSHSSGAVSDITHFYSSMGLTGMGFSETGEMPPPPPYSDLPNEPPPPYTQEAQTSNRSSSDLSQNEHAILW